MRIQNRVSAIIIIGMVAIPLALLIVAVISFNSIEEYQLLHSKQRHSISPNYAETYEHHSAKCSKEATLFLAVKCLFDGINANREAQRSNQDLQAQQEMAEWAYAQLLLSVVSTIISLFGFVGLIYSLALNREATNALINAERPHVRLFTTSKKRTTAGRVLEVYGVTFKNYGRVPAIVESLSIQYVLSDNPPDPKRCSYTRQYTDGAIMAGNEVWPHKGFVPQMDKGLPDINSLLAESKTTKMRLFVFGAIVYKDAFNSSRITHFCRQLDGRGNFTFNNGDIDQDKSLNYAD